MMLSVAYGAKSTQGIEIKLHLPQEVLAQLIGATRQRVNQIVGDWSEQGIVAQQYGRITLLNIQRLEELSRL
jgi:CRP/FNR family cyclic AMP-dependent transcriptional regulator